MALTNRIGADIIQLKIEGADEAAKELDNVEESSKKVEKQTKKTDKETEALGNRFRKLGKEIAVMSAGLIGLQSAAAAFGTAISSLKGGVTLAKDFERQFAQVKTLNREIGDDLRSDILKLASELPQSASDIASASYQAISAGVQPTDLVEFLRSASFTATAAGGSMTEAVEVLTAGVNAFGSQGETAATIANKLFATVRGGVTTIPELNAVFGRATAAASSYGVSVDEVLAAIAQMTKQGIPTTEAVTRINAVLKELSNESGTAAKQLKKSGVEVGVLALQQKGLLGVLEEVNKATDGQAVEIARLSGRQEAVQGMLKLTGDNFAAYAEQVNTVKNDTTALTDANREMGATTQHVSDIFNSAKEGAFRALGEEVLPALRDLLISITKQLSTSGTGFRTFGKFIGGIVKTVQLFSENVGKLGASLLIAFGSKYAVTFVKSLAQMRVALTNFSAMSEKQAFMAGRRYGQAFATQAANFIKSPAGIGLIAFGVMSVIDGINERRQKAEEEAAEKRTKINKQELAQFIAQNKIRMGEVQKRLSLAERERTIALLRRKSNEALMSDDNERARSLQGVALELERQAGVVPNLDEAYDKNKEQAKALLEALSDLPFSTQSVMDSFDKTVQSSKSLEMSIEAAENAIIGLQQAEETALQMSEQDSNVKKDLAIQTASLTEEQRILTSQINALEAAYQGANAEGAGAGDLFDALFGTSIGLASKIENLKKEFQDLEEQKAGVGAQTEQLEQQMSFLSQETDRAASSIDNLERTLSELRDLQDQNSLILQDNARLEGEVLTDREKAHKAIADAMADELKIRKENNDQAGVDLIRKNIQLQQRAWDRANKAQKAYHRAATAESDKLKRALETIRKIQDKEAQLKRDRAEMVKKANREEAQSALENQRLISEARLAADRTLTPVERLKARYEMEDKFAQKFHEQELKRIDEVEKAELESARKRMEANLRRLKASVPKGQVNAAVAAEKARGEAERQNLQKKAELERQAAQAEADRSKKLSDVERPAEQAQVSESQRRSEIDYELQRNSMLESGLARTSEMRLEYHDRDTKLMLDQMRLTEEYQKASNDRQIQMEKDLGDARKKVRMDISEEIRDISLAESASAAQGVSNSLSTIASLSQEMGGSDSFVGKIQAAQILADGVFHAFQGASDQAKALSAFATPGGQATGIAFQAAAIAHFAQAAAAPIMAARAVSAGRGGGGSGSAGGVSGGGAVSGPRRPATEVRAEAAKNQASIQFGDIVLSDVPALLSRNGSRQLGRQIAGDVAQAIARSRALPGGSRI